ncbi:hypothetical protein FACS189499_07000 [Clostridia bacterium]|nr:hypothetical protein FACS189499_07000 [Clostridia bacterium]
MPEFIDFDPEFPREKPKNPKRVRRRSGNLFVDSFLDLIPHKGESPGDVARKIIFLLMLPLLLISSLYIVDYYFLREEKMAAELDEVIRLRNEGIRNAPVTLYLDSDGNLSANASPATKTLEIIPEYAEFTETVDDFIGWVKIPPIVDFSVVQGTDNEYYLEHNMYKVRTANGTIFTDYEGDFSDGKRPHNTILYGHNLKTHYFFEPLINYRNNMEFAKNHPTVQFDTKYERGTYKIFAVFLTNTLTQQGEVFKYWNTVYFKNRKAFDNYVGEAIDRSYYFTGVDVEYGDEILTLSTCDFTMDETRLVVMARRVRENESPLVDPDKFADNGGTNADGLLRRKMFDAYYKMHGNTGWGGRRWEMSGGEFTVIAD